MKFYDREKELENSRKTGNKRKNGDA